jgi:hypothetical protein
MKIVGFIVLFLCLLKCSSEKAYNLRFRNTLLRVYIASDKKKVINEYSHKLVNETKLKASDCYNKLVTKYYDINLLYNSLTNEEKDLIEVIISLC